MSSHRRERQLARDRTARHGTGLRGRDRRRRRDAVVAAATAAAVLLGVVGFSLLGLLRDGGGRAAPAGDPSPDPAAAEQERPVACGASAPPPPEPQTYETEPPPALEPDADYVMTLRTSCGDIVVDLDEDAAPRTVSSFRFLAERDFFDGAPFSRLTGPADGFVVLQGGDQEGTGAGGPGYVLPDEALPEPAAGTPTYPRGTVALANAGPGTGGSQFFLVGADTAAIPAQYTPFGRVEAGLDVLDRILALGHDGSHRAGGGRPSERVFLEDLTVSTR